jgi:D-3-phosphoglycerate dehydrogenase
MGSGMEVIDVDYANSRGIRCYSSPEGNCNAVAEHALGLLLGLTKKIASSNEEVRQGKWLREENRGMELEGKTIGIIGFGHTGAAFAKKLAGFDMRVLAYDKYKQDLEFAGVDFCKDLELIFQEADIISFHVPLQEDTLHYFNQDFLKRMHKPFILLNTSRGQVVKTDTILEGLHLHKILAAGLDVLEEEPLEKASESFKEKLRKIQAYSNVIITPHIAGYSFEALYKMSKTLLNKIVTTR